MAPLLCDRPHPSEVDFETSRFVVADWCGMRIGTKSGTKLLELGDEVPRGALDAESLRMEYEVPMRRIETIEFAMKLDHLREACARRGVRIDPVTDRDEMFCAEEAAPVSQSPAFDMPQDESDLDNMTRQQLMEFCQSRGVVLHPTTSTSTVRKRAGALLPC